jgi:hypothetical protein
MRRHAGKIHIVAIAGFAMFVSFAILTDQPAIACDCAWPKSPREELQRADAVFSGEVSRINREEDKIEFRVEKIWKGPLAKRISIQYELSDCTYLFGVGKKYLVYAHDYKNRKEIFETSKCDRTTEIDKASVDLKELGEGEEP